MRVLLAATSTLPDRMGGGERVLWHLAHGLVSLGHDVTIVVPRTLARPERSTEDGVTIVRYPNPCHSFGSLYLTSIWAARRVIGRLVADRAVDVIHSNQGLSGLAASFTGFPRLCYTFYGPWFQEFTTEVLNRREMPAWKRWSRALWVPAKAGFARRVEAAAIRRSRAVVALSTFSLRQLDEIHGIAPSRVDLIPGGVDLKRFAPTMDRRDARRLLGLDGAGPLLFTVRRLVPRMGLESLLHALARLPRVRLVVAGAGFLRPRLEQTAAALRVADRVRFAGFVSDADLSVYYQAADLTVLPSVALEGFGLITLESLASGTPVVATPDSGTTDLLEPFEPSWISADASPEAFARCVESVLPRALGEPGLRERCRAHAMGYSWDRMVDAHEALYRSLGTR